MNLFKSNLIIFFLLANIVVFSQEDPKIWKQEFLQQVQGFDEAWERLLMGDHYYSKRGGYYKDAREEYLKAYAYNSSNAELNYKLGICYLYSDQKTEAVKYLEKSFQTDASVTGDIHFQLGRAYHMRLEFDEAIKEYNLYKTSFTKYKRIPVNVDKYIEECYNGKDLVSKPMRVIISNLGRNINSDYDDYHSVVSENDSLMYYTSKRPASENTKRNYFYYKYPEDIYMSVKDSSKWGKSKLVGADTKFNTSKDDAMLYVTPDNKKFFVYNGGKRKGDIYIIEKVNGTWKRKPFRAINTRKYTESGFAATRNMDTIYFVTNNKKYSKGGKDILWCIKDAKGKWSKPHQIDSINTVYDEDAVALSPDGHTMYFSSKGHNTMGGYDVFVSVKNENGDWGKPVNVGYPINTPDDDLYYTMSKNKKFAYYSTIREGTLGFKDIFKVIYLGSEKELLLSTEIDPIAYFKFDKPSIIRKPIPLLEIDSTIIMQGRLLDSKTKDKITSLAKINLIDPDKSLNVASSVSDSMGNYKIKLSSKKKFGIEISAKDYLLYLEVFDISKEPGDVIKKDFTIQKIEVGQKVVLRNLFFETGKAVLKPESTDELEKVLKFLKDNETIKLEISGHTDNQGSLQFNTKLSESRAKAVVDWLLSNGVDKGRLTYKGYAFTEPVGPNTTPAGRALNRRVEFKIMDK